MSKLDWVRNRTRGVHMTIRDVDCRDFDVEQFTQDMRNMHVEFFSFFAGGYITTYPTHLKYQRMSPFLEGRDLTGDIIEAAHRYGIKAIPMIDLGPLSKAAAEDHPEWCACDVAGNPYRINEDLYVACALGGYQQTFAKEMVEELVSRYDADGMKFGGGSYGFQSYGAGICYCPACREDFYRYGQADIPLARDWNDPNWRRFVRWRIIKTGERVKFLHDVVKSVDPELLVMGNAICFGGTDWTTRASLDIEAIAHHVDSVQIEAQTRLKLDTHLSQAHWDSLTFTTEEARYLTSVSDKPVWIVVSYFLAWPWRRSAVPYAEQKAWMAQIAANGASPMVNLSGGPPAVHEDKRGFKVVTDLYGFLKEHHEYYNHDHSAANVAIVYSQDTLYFYGKDDPDAYVQCIRGVEQALQEAHIPFDILSTNTLAASTLSKYRTLILPSLACLSEEEARAIREYVAGGGGLVSTFETSLYDSDGGKREDFLFKDIFAASYKGKTVGPTTGTVDGVLVQSYMNLEESHPILEGLEGTTVVPNAGYYCHVEPNAQAAKIPLTLYPPFRVFPEGISYGTENHSSIPLAIASERNNRGRSVYFPTEIDKLFWNTGYPDLKKLIVNAVKWTAQADFPITVDAPPTLLVSLRQKDHSFMVHLVNLTAGHRIFDELVPLHDVRIGLRQKNVTRAFLLSSGEAFPVHIEGSVATVVVPKLQDYDVLVFETR